MTIREYLQKAEQAELERLDAACCAPWRLQYHLMPPVGWLNDPNGLCQLNGTYHIFYQYIPIRSGRKKVCWGHYSTQDFTTFIRHPIAVYPDSFMDCDGAYSGGAIVIENVAHFFYTGNIRFDGEYDYIHSGRGQYVNHFSTADGVAFTPKENLLRNSDYPSDMSCHVRDPHIIKDNDVYFMVLGGRTHQDEGCVLFYSSRDLAEWQYVGRAAACEPFGYMWECPNLITVDGQSLLLVCPQGVAKRGIRFENAHQSGYFVMNCEPVQEIILNDFVELDYGFDFYAPQVFTDEKGRNILIGWMGMPDASYENPTKAHGWENALTLPRQLKWKNNRLYQYPIEETKDLRREYTQFDLQANFAIDLRTRAFEAQIEICYDEFIISFRRDAELHFAKGLLTFSLGESGYGRKQRHAEIPAIQSISIFSDTSCLEIYVNGGEYVLTTRLYDSCDDTRLQIDKPAKVEVYTLAGYTIKDSSYPDVLYDKALHGSNFEDGAQGQLLLEQERYCNQR